MDNALHPMTLEEVQAAPPGAMVYMEYRFERKYHQSGLNRASTVRALICRDYMQAHYGQRFRCWPRKPGQEDIKAHEWRENPC